MLQRVTACAGAFTRQLEIAKTVLMEPIKVFIVDDHGVIREILTRLLDADPLFKVVGQASGSNDLFRQIDNVPTDVVIVDLSMTDIDGVACTERLRRHYPNLKVLILTGVEDAVHVRKSVAAGAHGFVLKSSGPETLELALQVVARGGFFLDPASSAVLPQLLTNRPISESEDEVALSAREKEVIVFLAQGFSVKQISRELSIKSKTVETYKARAMEKLNFSSRAQLIRYAFEHGWLKNLKAADDSAIVE